MPLLDHFRPPLYPRHKWNSFHSNWATRIADALNRRWLPSGFLAEEYTTSGARLEIDVATFDEPPHGIANGAVVATRQAPAWTPPAARRSFPITLTDECEVCVQADDGRLVAAIELVGPANKDRPESRAAFAAKCAGYLMSGVSVVIVDVVTSRLANLHHELLQLLDAPRASDLPAEAFQYAVSYRPVARGEHAEVELWPFACAVGQPLPTVPMHLIQDIFVPIELEATYMEACRSRRLIPDD